MMWEWPQYLMLFWWGFSLALPPIARIADIRIGGSVRPTPVQWAASYITVIIQTSVLAFVLYAGGFFG